MTKSPYWRDFIRREDVETAVRALVDAQDFGREFESSLISDLILERHYFCRMHGLRPTVFKLTHEDRPYRFYGFFAEHGWHPVSWTKCLKPPPSKQLIIVAALRNRIEPEKLAFRKSHPICARCGQAASEETHHAAPTFDEITRQVFATVTAADIDTALADWDWFDQKVFAVPEGHVIQQCFDAIHSSARLEALCKSCHNQTKRRPKAIKTGAVASEQGSVS